MDQNELQHGDLTEDSLFSDAVLYKEIVRKNPDSIPQLFNELKIKEIEQYVSWIEQQIYFSMESWRFIPVFPIVFGKCHEIRWSWQKNILRNMRP